MHVDSEDRAHDHLASMAIDGDPETFWHTRWQPNDPMPHELVIDIGREVMLKGVTYLPRQDMASGRIAEAEIYCSSDLARWGQPVANAKWRDSADVQSLIFPRPIKARYLKLVATREQRGQPFLAIAELDIIAERSIAAPGAARSAPQEAKGVAVRIEPDKVAIGNEFLVWEMKLASGRHEHCGRHQSPNGKSHDLPGRGLRVGVCRRPKHRRQRVSRRERSGAALEGGGKQLVVDFTHKDAAAEPDHRNQPRPVVGAALAHGPRGPRTVGRRDLCALGLRRNSRPFGPRHYGPRARLPQRLRPTTLCGRPLPGHCASGRQQLHDCTEAYPAVSPHTTRSPRMLPSNRGSSCSAPARPALPVVRYWGISTRRDRWPRT